MTETRIPQVGVVGCGYWGRNLVRNFHELGSLAAICDVQQASLDEMAKKYPVKATTRYEELLEMPEVQGVVIAAPAAQHFSLAKKAILAGKDVMVEKPLALRVEEGEELVRLAKARSRILMVGHLLHYHPAITELRHMVQAGEFRAARYFGDFVLVERNAESRFRAGRELPQSPDCGRYTFGAEFRQRREGARLCELDSSLQRTKTDFGRRSPDGGF